MKKIIAAILVVMSASVVSAESSWEFDSTATGFEALGIDGTGTRIDVEGFGDKTALVKQQAQNTAQGATVYDSPLSGASVGAARILVINDEQADKAAYILEVNSSQNYTLWQDRQLTVSQGEWYNQDRVIQVKGYDGAQEVAAVAGAAALVFDRFNTKNYETRAILLDTRDGIYLNLERALSPVGGIN